MSDPTFRNHPPLYGRDQSYAPWIITALAVLAIVGGLSYGMSYHIQTAVNGPPQTTGQGGPLPPLSLPTSPTTNEPATEGL